MMSLCRSKNSCAAASTKLAWEWLPSSYVLAKMMAYFGQWVSRVLAKVRIEVGSRAKVLSRKSEAEPGGNRLKTQYLELRPGFR